MNKYRIIEGNNEDSPKFYQLPFSPLTKNNKVDSRYIYKGSLLLQSNLRGDWFLYHSKDNRLTVFDCDREKGHEYLKGYEKKLNDDPKTPMPDTHELSLKFKRL